MSRGATLLFGLLLLVAIGTAIPLHRTLIFCPSGDTVLLEGHHDRPFKCRAHSDCPAGFDCRLLVVGRGGTGGGVCCPDMAKLNLIYADSGQQPEHRLLELPGFPLTPHPDVSVVRNQVEQRAVRWRARAMAANSPWLRPQWATAKRILEREKFSCKRQRLDYHCSDNENRGRRQTQFVVRWYYDLKEQRCLFYPWGYCTGDPIASDSTLRTREECEILCVPPPTTTVTETMTSSDTRLLESSTPPEPTWTRESAATFVSLRTSATTSATPSTTPISTTTRASSRPISTSQTTAVSPETIEDIPLGCLRRSSYRTTCSNGLASQFTLRSPHLRWYSKGDACFAYPYGYCNNEPLGDGDSTTLSTELECKETCLRWRTNTG